MASALTALSPLDGRYANFVSAGHAAPAWAALGAQIALADLPDDEQGYNGDPDRLGDRTATEGFAATRGLMSADSVAAAVCFLASTDAASINGSIHAVDAGRTAG